MSKKQFEENLNYGDSNNFFCFLDKILDGVSGIVEQNIGCTKNIDKIKKSQ
jgi:hypothetical protein